MSAIPEPDYASWEKVSRVVERERTDPHTSSWIAAQVAAIEDGSIREQISAEPTIRDLIKTWQVQRR